MRENFCIKTEGNFVNNYRLQSRPIHDLRKNSNSNLPAAAIEMTLYRRQQKPFIGTTSKKD
jgi:hypothetical protein